MRPGTGRDGIGKQGAKVFKEPPSRSIVRTEADELGHWKVDVVGANGPRDRGEREGAVHVGWDDARVHTAKLRHAALLVIVDVRLVAHDEFGAAVVAVHEDTDQVAHRPRRHEQASVLAEQRRRLGLELLHRRVLAHDIVADRRRRHGLAPPPQTSFRRRSQGREQRDEKGHDDLRKETQTRSHPR